MSEKLLDNFLSNLKTINDLWKNYSLKTSYLSRHIFFRFLTLNFLLQVKQDVFRSRRGVREDNGFFLLKILGEWWPCV